MKTIYDMLIFEFRIKQEKFEQFATNLKKKGLNTRFKWSHFHPQNKKRNTKMKTKANKNCGWPKKQLILLRA